MTGVRGRAARSHAAGCGQMDWENCIAPDVLAAVIAVLSALPIMVSKR
jgi:hypothetical protein